MEKKLIERTRERLKEEWQLMTFVEYKGHEHGMRDALEFGWREWDMYRALFGEHRVSVEQFEGDEQELRELYESVRARNQKRILNVTVKRAITGEALDGLYDVIISEEPVAFSVGNMEEDKRKRYLRYWLIGVRNMSKEIDLKSVQSEAVPPRGI